MMHKLLPTEAQIEKEIIQIKIKIKTNPTFAEQNGSSPKAWNLEDISKVPGVSYRCNIRSVFPARSDSTLQESISGPLRAKSAGAGKVRCRILPATCSFYGNLVLAIIQTLILTEGFGCGSLNFLRKSVFTQ
jgi:hypothetical protein